ncbi:hypothetical protein CPCC7001_348 [Cyanobium sp. PCC 7001]|nr:hypothetical protein CPCC7001_348 [Cyanobium sp. PCC 7001]
MSQGWNSRLQPVRVGPSGSSAGLRSGRSTAGQVRRIFRIFSSDFVVKLPLLWQAAPG